MFFFFFFQTMYRSCIWPSKVLDACMRVVGSNGGAQTTPKRPNVSDSEPSQTIWGGFEPPFLFSFSFSFFYFLFLNTLLLWAFWRLFPKNSCATNMGHFPYGKMEKAIG